jgi:hypothetical protein
MQSPSRVSFVVRSFLVFSTFSLFLFLTFQFLDFSFSVCVSVYISCTLRVTLKAKMSFGCWTEERKMRKSLYKCRVEVNTNIEEVERQEKTAWNFQLKKGLSNCKEKRRSQNLLSSSKTKCQISIFWIQYNSFYHELLSYCIFLFNSSIFSLS